MIGFRNLKINKLSIPDIAYWSVFAAASFLLLNHHIFNSDEGVVLTGAWNLLNGKSVYVDSFQFTPPGSYYLIFAIWKICGVSYLAARLVSITFIIIAAVGLYKICLLFKLLKKRSACLPPVYLLLISVSWSIISYHAYNLAFLIWATYFFMVALKRRERKFTYLSAVIVWFASIFLLHKTVVLAFAMFAYLLYLAWRERRSYWLKAAAAYILSGMATIFFLLSFWPWRAIYDNLIVFPLLHYPEINKTSLSLFVFILIIIFILAAIYKNRPDDKIKFLLWLQFWLLASALSRPDHFHVTLILFPLFCLLPMIWQSILAAKSEIKTLFSLIYITLALLFLWPGMPFMLNLKNLLVKDDNYLLNYIKNNCTATETIYAGPFLPYIYFETRKLNPLPYDWMLTGMHPDSYFWQAREILEKEPPQCAVINYQGVSNFRYEQNNPLDNFLKDNYRLILKQGEFYVLSKI